MPRQETPQEVPGYTWVEKGQAYVRHLGQLGGLGQWICLALVPFPGGRFVRHGATRVGSHVYEIPEFTRAFPSIPAALESPELVALEAASALGTPFHELVRMMKE